MSINKVRSGVPPTWGHVREAGRAQCLHSVSQSIHQRTVNKNPRRAERSCPHLHMICLFHVPLAQNPKKKKKIITGTLRLAEDQK
jgi:hypothetical protein